MAATRLIKVAYRMAIYVVLLPEPQLTLAERIEQLYPEDHFKLSDLQWIISSPLSIIDLTAKLEIYNLRQPDTPSSGNAVLFSILSYYGRGPATLWDWLRAKQEPRAGV